MIGPNEGRSKKLDMPVGLPSARCSLVKGERIVRSVLSIRLCMERAVRGGCYTRGVAVRPQPIWYVPIDGRRGECVRMLRKSTSNMEELFSASSTYTIAPISLSGAQVLEEVLSLQAAAVLLTP